MTKVSKIEEELKECMQFWGQGEDVLFVYDLLGVYKIKFKLIFRWEIETNGNEKRKLIHLFWRGRYK